MYGRALREQPDAERARLAALAVAATVPAGARLLHALHRWTAYGVVPVFGLANAGVTLDAETLRAAATSSVTIGVAVALLVGNAIGHHRGRGRGAADRLGHPARRCALVAPHGRRDAGRDRLHDLAVHRRPGVRRRAAAEQATIGILAGSVTAAVVGVVLLRFLGERFPLCSPGTEGPPTLPPRPWVDPAVRVRAAAADAVP